MATTAVKERPILFSGEMVRAILDGRKTQTRRLYKGYFLGDSPTWPDEGKGSCPYGAPGDRLWVRETVCCLDCWHWHDSSKPRDYLYNLGHPRRNGCAYRANTDAEGDAIRKEYGYKWTPAIHMPRWASRIALELTDVRVERLQQITPEDAIAEGVMRVSETDPAKLDRWEREQCQSTAVACFRAVWERINGKGSWDANPRVWVVAFRRLANG